MIKEELLKNWKTYTGFGLGVLAVASLTAIISSKKKKPINNITRESLKNKENPFDMDKMIDNLSKIEDAKKLREKLKRKVHRDRFVGDEVKMELADEIAKEFNEERNILTYSKLVELKEKAERELGIQID